MRPRQPLTLTVTLSSTSPGSLELPLRRVPRWPHCLVLVLVLAWCVASVACNDLVTDSRAATGLVLEVLQGSPGTSATFTGSLQSDVVSDSGSVFADPGRVGLRLSFKDPGTSANPSSPTSANWITVTRYHVKYLRGDERNEQGRDVPYEFDGGLTLTVIDTISEEFTLVRAQAKLEPPLLALRGNGGAVIIATVAEITFFGHDQTGAATRVTGLINVTFADFAG